MGNRVAAGRRFSAGLEMCDVDSRYRPGPTWTVRSISISRSHISVLSRRMCYTGGLVAAAIHMIDADPVVLFGIISDCAYDAEGLYQVDISFRDMPKAAEEGLRLLFSGQAAA